MGGIPRFCFMTSQIFTLKSETRYPDEEDENGEIVEKGTRQKGVSKEHKNQPIVQMAMFLDNSGIPIAINMFPGNTLDHQTAVPTYEETVSKMGI